MKVVLRSALVLVVAAVGALAYTSLRSARDEIVIAPRQERATLVEVVPVVTESVALAVETFGRVQPAREARLSAEVTARVVRLAPEAVLGGRVRAGEVLVELDRAQLELTRVAAQAQVAEARAALAREEAEAEMARRDLERAGVAEPGPLALRAPQLAGARAALESAEAALARAALDVERATLVAPFDGLVTAEGVELGQVVSTGTRLFDLVQTAAFEVRLPLVARDVGLLEPLGVGEVRGPQVELLLDTAGRRARFDARIVRTLPELDPVSRALVAVARVEDPLGGPIPLRLGDFVRVRIEGRRLADAVRLPEAAIRAGDEVWLADAEDRLERRPVTVVQRRDGHAIVERGLAPGERVIVSALESAPVGLPLDVRAAGAAPSDGAASNEEPSTAGSVRR